MRKIKKKTLKLKIPRKKIFKRRNPYQFKRNLYDILGVEKSADLQTIKRAYHKLQVQYQQEAQRFGTNSDKLQEINAAYEILSDSELRRSYDLYGKTQGKQFIPDDKPKQSKTSWSDDRSHANDSSDRRSPPQGPPIPLIFMKLLIGWIFTKDVDYVKKYINDLFLQSIIDLRIKFKITKTSRASGSDTFIYDVWLSDHSRLAADYIQLCRIYTDSVGFTFGICRSGNVTYTKVDKEEWGVEDYYVNNKKFTTFTLSGFDTRLDQYLPKTARELIIILSIENLMKYLNIFEYCKVFINSIDWKNIDLLFQKA